MDSIVIAVHIVVAGAIIGLILLQQGKGAEMGASFGSGSSQTVFGAQGTGTVFSRATAICTALFFITSFWLALIAKDRINGSIEEGIPSADVIQAATTEVSPTPVKEIPAVKNESEIPAATQPAESEIPQ